MIKSQTGPIIWWKREYNHQGLLSGGLTESHSLRRCVLWVSTMIALHLTSLIGRQLGSRNSSLHLSGSSLPRPSSSPKGLALLSTSLLWSLLILNVWPCHPLCLSLLLSANSNSWKLAGQFLCLGENGQHFWSQHYVGKAQASMTWKKWNNRVKPACLHRVLCLLCCLFLAMCMINCDLHSASLANSPSPAFLVTFFPLFSLAL